MKVGIQGGYGAFHEIAANHYFMNKEFDIVPFETFDVLVDGLKSNKINYALLAIENSIAGGILPNYKLIIENQQFISGEVFVRICQNLVALPGQRTEDLDQVFSHPMALLQCKSFFKRYPGIKLIDKIDTALSAREIRKKRLLSTGAIASDIAAEKYDLEIIASDIADDKSNYTRFLILSNSEIPDKEGFNKATIWFTLSNEKGSLMKVLTLLCFYQINLTKIQSIPIPDTDWEYQFILDLEFSNYKQYRSSLKAIEPFCLMLKILGEYLKGRKIK